MCVYGISDEWSTEGVFLKMQEMDELPFVCAVRA